MPQPTITAVVDGGTDAELTMMLEDVSAVLRPYGLVPGDCRACAMLLRELADRLEACGHDGCPLNAVAGRTPQIPN